MIWPREKLSRHTAGIISAGPAVNQHARVHFDEATGVVRLPEGELISAGDRMRLADQPIPHSPPACVPLASPKAIIALILMQDSGLGVKNPQSQKGNPV